MNANSELIFFLPTIFLGNNSIVLTGVIVQIMENRNTGRKRKQRQTVQLLPKLSALNIHHYLQPDCLTYHI